MEVQFNMLLVSQFCDESESEIMFVRQQDNKMFVRKFIDKHYYQ